MDPFIRADYDVVGLLLWRGIRQTPDHNILSAVLNGALGIARRSSSVLLVEYTFYFVHYTMRRKQEFHRISSSVKSLLHYVKTGIHLLM